MSSLLPLLRGGLPASKLPRMFSLADIQTDLAELCKNSLGVHPPLPPPIITEARFNEWGACLLVTNNGSGWKIEVRDKIEGETDCVKPTCKPDDHQPPVWTGYAHTHPPIPVDVSVPGITTRCFPYPGFSSIDYVSTLTDGDNVALVCNGVQVFALVRNDRTEARKNVSTESLKEWKELELFLVDEAKRIALGNETPADEIHPTRQSATARLHKLIRQHTGTNRAAYCVIDAARMAFNFHMCAELKFAFYQGEWGGRVFSVLAPPVGRLSHRKSTSAIPWRADAIVSLEFRATNLPIG